MKSWMREQTFRFCSVFVKFQSPMLGTRLVVLLCQTSLVSQNSGKLSLKENSMKTKLIAMAVPLFAVLSLTVHAQTFTDRPTTQSTPGTPYLNPAKAYDDNFSTAATASVTEGVKGAKSDIEIWSGFSSAPGGANTIKLNVNSSASCNALGTVTVSYSLNGGSTFTVLYMLENGTRGQQTDSVSLSNSQNLTEVQVKAESTAFNTGSGIGTAANSAFEIWISGND